MIHMVWPSAANMAERRRYRVCSVRRVSAERYCEIVCLVQRRLIEHSGEILCARTARHGVLSVIVRSARSVSSAGVDVVR